MQQVMEEGQACFPWTHCRIDTGEPWPAEVTLTRLQLPVVVAGVTTAEQQRCLREMGCSSLQGDALVPPLTAEAFQQQWPGSRQIDA